MPYDPLLPVDTDWDLGIDDTTAIWFSQSLRSDWRMALLAKGFTEVALL